MFRRFHGPASRIGTLLALMLAVSLSTWACRDQSPLPPEPFATAVPDGNPFSHVGELHNEALAYVLAHLQARSRAGQLTLDNLRELAFAAMDRFFQARGLGRVDWGLVRSAQESGGRGAAPVSTFQLPRSAMAFSDFPPHVQKYFDEILYHVDTAPSLAELKSRLASLDTRASAQLAGEERDVVLSVSSIGASSWEYWASEAAHWFELCSADLSYCGVDPGDPGDGLEMMDGGWFSWYDGRRTTRKDVVGGIIGAVGGVKGALLGAAGTSLAEIITQVVEQLI